MQELEGNTDIDLTPKWITWIIIVGFLIVIIVHDIIILIPLILCWLFGFKIFNSWIYTIFWGEGYLF
jgi:hypothetical protein